MNKSVTMDAILETDNDGDSVSSSFSSSCSSGSSATTVMTRKSVVGRKSVAIGDKESIAVSRWRTVVVLMLISTAALVCTSTYVFLNQTITNEFEKSFEQSALSIMDAAEFTARDNIQIMQIFADGITTEALAINASWPFFTSQNFEVTAARSRIAGFEETIMFMPMVTGRQRKDWEFYSLREQGWIQKSRELGIQTEKWLNQDEYYGANNKRRLQEETDETIENPNNIAEKIFVKGEDNPGGTEGDMTPIPALSRSYYTPVWQVSPPPSDPKIINYNFLADSVSYRLFNAIEASGGKPIVSELLKPTTIEFFNDGLLPSELHKTYHDSSQNVEGNAGGLNSNSFPHFLTMAPVLENFSPGAKTVGYVAGISPWDFYLSRLLPENVNGIQAVLMNSCSQVVTYVINGPIAVYLGDGDLHDSKWDKMKQTLEFTGFGQSTAETRKVGHCDYSLELYPTDVFEESFDTSRPLFFTLILAFVFAITGFFFFVFVFNVQRRQKTVMASAVRTNAIVSSLFPSVFRDRIMVDAGKRVDTEKRNVKHEWNDQSKSFEELEGERDESNVFGTKPIADLFPHTTLMFADLRGFTAWSSVRQPTQVFTLLETVYYAFDRIAKKRRVFKVETVGDCYVAVVGLPDPRKDHAVTMARFAKDCQDKFYPLVKKLEKTLGPDTGDLAMRFGIHSGPVTGGVLRGERARFQLFGDTMNTASRMETTGKPGFIHLSQETADLLIQAGKEHWVVPREDKVNAKGKGELQTYWLVMRSRDVSSGAHESSTGDSEAGHDIAAMTPEARESSAIGSKTKRLVDWNVDTLMRMLRKVVARREAKGILAPAAPPRLQHHELGTVIDEVREIISLPTFDPNIVDRENDKINLGETIEQELCEFVTSISILYRNNPFHNFEHASHVTMSVVKLLARIVSPSLTNAKNIKASLLHDHTYGITSDPLTQFACVFSALIHDVDHRGVPNAQLIKDEVSLAKLYKCKSVAEQNSVDIAWELLMSQRFQNLRKAIYINEDELNRFRALVVNSVMATDLMDKDLKALRNGRWEKAFSEANPGQQESKKDIVDRKATIVIEHLIQASDVSHTMQHWHVYRKWNQRLFLEIYKAFKEGRSENDPSEFWYKGELGFFDFYVIPLAKKLKQCGVFGVSCDEYLNYAEKNRAEWEIKGKEVVMEMMENIDEQLEYYRT